MPADLVMCSGHKVVLPTGDWTPEQVVAIVKKYRVQEGEDCARRIVKFYDDLRTRLAQ